MNQKEFKRAMMCGLGRCITELQTCPDKEKYRNIVLWACTHNISFDKQLEGTRAYYVSEMIDCFSEEETFLDTAIERFMNLPYGKVSDFWHLCTLLSIFEQKGNQKASEAFAKKYQILYRKLLKARKRPQYAYFPLMEQFERLCVELASDHLSDYLRIAEDIGNLFLHNPLIEDRDFDWLYTHAEQTFGKKKTEERLQKASLTNPALAEYFNKKKPKERVKSVYDKSKKTKQQINLLDFLTANYFDIKKAGKFIKSGGAKAALQLAEATLQETNVSKKADMIRFFAMNSYTQWPLSVEPLIELSKSPAEKLSSIAFRLLETIRDDTVRGYAFELLESGTNDEDALCLLAQNYQKNDQDLFVIKVTSIPLDIRNLKWHRVFMSVIDMFGTGEIQKAPMELLKYIYDHSYCGYCRNKALRIMGRKHKITPEMWEECRWDSYDGIREYARRHFSRIESNTKKLQ